MNKFEQVFSDHHQMLLAGGSPGLMSRSPGWGTLPDLSPGGLEGEGVYGDDKPSEVRPENLVNLNYEK